MESRFGLWFLSSILLANYFMFCCIQAKKSTEKTILLVAGTNEKESNIYEVDINAGSPANRLLPPKIASDSQPLAVTFDVRSSTLYWTDVRYASISKYKLGDINNSYNKLFSNITDQNTLDCLVYDESTEMLYYCQHNKNKSMGVVGQISQDGRKHKFLIRETGSKPRAVVIDSAKRHLYWSDWGDHPGIYRANLDDGSYKISVVTAGMKWPNGFYIDFEGGMIFWADSHTYVIEKCKFPCTQSQRHVLINDTSSHFSDMTGLQSSVFYTDFHSPYVKKIDSELSKTEIVAGPIPGVLNGLAIVKLTNITPLKQQEAIMRTEENQATTDNYLNLLNMVNRDVPTDVGHAMRHDDEDVGLLVGLIIVALLLVLAIAIFLIYFGKKVKRRARSMPQIPPPIIPLYQCDNLYEQIETYENDMNAIRNPGGEDDELKLKVKNDVNGNGHYVGNNSSYNEYLTPCALQHDTTTENQFGYEPMNPKDNVYSNFQ